MDIWLMVSKKNIVGSNWLAIEFLSSPWVAFWL